MFSSAGRAESPGRNGILQILLRASRTPTLGLTLVAALTLAATPVLIVVWVLFAIFTLYFFRDPTARVPAGANLVLSPGHGKVDGIDTVTEPQFMGGECQRITIFLSVLNV